MQAVRKVIQILNQHGYDALLAGGCVRDMLLGKKPADYDVATNATPDAMTKIFDRTLTVGAQFGVVVVLLGQRQIEVATFRSDIEYQDGRRPQSIVFTDAKEDALRRDFTINGMFYDLIKEQVLDYVGGKNDLEKGIIRAIGHADDRFAEDHLRMLRAIRFSCRFDFDIDDSTLEAIKKHAHKISRVSVERILVELQAILMHPNRSMGLKLSKETGLLKAIFPKIDDTIMGLGLETIQYLPKECSSALSLSTLLVGCQPDQIKKIARELKTSNDLRKQMIWLSENRLALVESLPLTKGRLKQWLNEPLFESLMSLLTAYYKACDIGLKPIKQLKTQIMDLGNESICPERLLDGRDLLALGAVAGPMVGQLKEEIYLAQLENQVKSKEQAEAWARDWLEKNKLKE